ncbi:MAG: haloalkane dehalogenase [Alphaproteobacteria bacterium]|nr:haloalkane dehalogenase [Alphaproteobacteria bacterium]MBE8220651.1 haloalkane dehalogenase [Alphaproteobacteria bacterium]
MTDNHPKKQIQVKGATMSYVELGDTNGRPIVFQHGNPTSSYLWRNIMPHLADKGRCIALDLIGMGDSDKLENSGADRYTFQEHRDYFEGALDALNINQDIIFVIHDWGSALGFDYIARHPDRVAGVCYMEAVVRAIPTWDSWPTSARNIFQALRSPAGEEMVLDKNTFVERILPASIIRDLSEEEMGHYRAPFLEEGESRRPTLTFPRQIPVAGEPADVVAIAENYAKHMAASEMPKLFINAEPGSILTGDNRDFCRKWKNQEEITVKGTHFIQEDSPNEIGMALKEWISNK